MSKTDPLSRRKMLGRIGLLAAAGYTVPALTTLSVAHAGSGASGGNDDKSNSAPSAPSEPSTASAPSRGDDDDNGGGTDGVPGTDPAVVEATCGVENLNDPAYLQCLVDNGF